MISIIVIYEAVIRPRTDVLSKCSICDGWLLKRGTGAYRSRSQLALKRAIDKNQSTFDLLVSMIERQFLMQCSKVERELDCQVPVVLVLLEIEPVGSIKYSLGSK